MVTNQPYNKLTPAEDERLTLLIEECAEVIQAATKIQRHGYEGTYPDSGETNRAALERELGDLQWAITHLVRRGDVKSHVIIKASSDKARRVIPYLHHQNED